jgi:hypothetical protein
MLSITSHTRFYLYQTPVSMHKSFEGLSSIAQSAFPEALFTGAFLFSLIEEKIA